MNAWQQVDAIAGEALSVLEDSLIIANLASRDKTSDLNKTPDGYAKGDTVRIKTHPDYEAKEFTTTVTAQGIRESTRSLTIEKHFDVSVELTAKEKALDFESFAEQVIRPAVYRLAEKCEIYVASKVLNGQGLYVSSALFDTAADMALARKDANYQQLDPAGRFCIVNDTLEATLLGKDYFIKYDNRGESGVMSFQEAAMGRAMGMQFYSSLQLPTLSHANGTGVAQTNNNSGANNLIGMTTLTIDSVNLSGAPINAGDRIRVAGVRRPLIVATTANGAAQTTIALAHPISEIIPDNAAVTVVGGAGTYTFQGVIMDSQSLAVAMPVLDKPSDKPSFVVSSNGFSIRVVTGYDMTTKTEMMSLDCLIGAEVYDSRRVTLIADK